MYLILDQTGLIACITADIAYVRRLGSGAVVRTAPETAEAIYASDNDTFYQTQAEGWHAQAYATAEVGSVPPGVVPGHWYYKGGEFVPGEGADTMYTERERIDFVEGWMEGSG